MTAATAIVIPHYDDPARLQTCLAALAPQVAGRDDVEVVVADNASPCDLSWVAVRFPFARVVTEPLKGAGAARNRGVAGTMAPQIAFLDSDCVPAPDWLARVRGLRGRPGAVGGRIDTFDETPAPRSGAEAFETVFAFDQKSYVEKKGFSVTANLVTSRAVFGDVGRFEVGVSEDVDWCVRASAKGHPLSYDDALRVAHPTRADWPALVRKWRRVTDEMFLLNGTSVAARLRWAIRALAVLVSGPAHLPRLLAHPGLASGLERRRGAATLLRIRTRRCLWMLGQAFGPDGAVPGAPRLDRPNP